MNAYSSKERSWKTNNQMKQAHGGHDQEWKKHMLAYAGILKAEIALERSISPAAAAKVVDAEYVGWRMSHGKEVLAISPKGAADLLSRLPKKLESGWQTAPMLREEIGGSDTLWRERIDTARRVDIEAVRHTLNIRSEDAEQLVDNHRAGDRKPRRGPATLAISPDVRHVIMEEHIPILPDDWRTPAMMSDQYGHGDERVWKRRMQKLADALPAQIAKATGMGLKDAEHHVDEAMIGLRTPKSGGHPTLGASPLVQEMLKDKHLPKPRER